MMTSENHKKIWKEIKRDINLVEAYMDAFIVMAKDLGNEAEDFRLSNLKRTFNRGIMMAASAKYLPTKDKVTREGYDFNAPAIVYCYEQVFSDIVIKKYASRPEEMPTKSQIREEAERWTFLGIHPEITDAAIKAYNQNKNYVEIISIFIKDKSLDFSAPVTKAIKDFFKKLF